MKPRLLDLFCGGGGAAVGYHRAGFDVVGVDLAAQPDYPFEFTRGDALEYLAAHGHEFDAIHASPPCQGYSPHVSSASSPHAGTLGRDEARLIGVVRALLERTGRPYVIENVWGARRELRSPVLLCGVMFGLPIPRHRLFESNAVIVQPWHFPCRGVAARFADERGWDRRDMTVTGKGRRAGTKGRWAEIMGIDWPMTQHQMRESIPPAFTAHVGASLLRSVEVAA